MDLTPIATGNDIQVNTTTVDAQRYSSVSALNDGGFVVTWSSYSQDGSDSDIHGQRYDASGAPVGTEFRVNTFTSDAQIWSSVVALNSGGFVVTWSSAAQDGSAAGIYGQRYDTSGAPAGAEFRVNTVTTNQQLYSSVTALISGGFVVTWTSYGASGSDVHGQRYDASGAPAGAEFRVNTVTSNDQQYSSVTALNSGGFVVTWSSAAQDGSAAGIYGQRYDTSGAPAGTEFRVNTFTSNDQQYSSVTALNSGGFVVTWSSAAQDGSDWGIYGQRYDASGAPAGTEFRVNTVTSNQQLYSSVTALNSDGFVVTWTSFGARGYDIYGQRYAADGTAVGSEFSINQITTGSQLAETPYGSETVTTLADGRLVQVWDGGGNEEVFFRLIEVPLPNTAPAINSNGGDDTAVVSVAENTTLVTMLTATDPDAGQTLSYSITGGEDAGLFEIRNGNELHFITAPDFEDLPGAGATLGYQVAVQVSDGNGGTDTQAIAVTVTDANEAPRFVFAGDGKVSTAFGSGDDFGRSLALQADGKILVAGGSFNGPNYDFAVARYNVDGSLDTSFGTGGKVITSLGSTFDGRHGFSVVVDANNKIVVAGYTNSSGPPDFALVRYNADGSLDTSFDGDGKATTSLTPFEDYGQGVVVQPDGKILVAGDGFNINGTFDFFLARYNPDGSLDASFGNGGKVATAIAFHDQSYSVVLQSDGKILAAGHSLTGLGPNDFAIVRYNTDGSIDTSFDGDGKVTTDFGGTNDVGRHVTVQPDGKILVAGYSSNGADFDFALVRYNTDGSLDTSFDGDGKLKTGFGFGDDFVASVTVQADGKILVAGNSFNGTNTDFGLVRYNSDGSLDTTFGSAGKVETQLGGAADEGYDVMVQPDGKILVSGFSNNGTDADFALVRYNADGSLDITFGAPEVVPLSISENTSSLSTLATTDPDAADTLTYTIAGGADAAKFSINAGTGALSFVTAPDFEAPGDADGNNIYDVTVQVSDGNGGTDTQAISVTVSNANDAPQVNAPSHLDIVIANYFSNNASVLLGDGTGEFAASIVNLAGGALPAGAGLGDFNRDGNTDIATANLATSDVSILLGDGAGNFSTSRTGLGGGSNPAMLAVGDFNHDGNLDIVTANLTTSGSVSVLLGDGTGGFTASAIDIGGSSTAASVAVGDIDGDGHLDIVTGNGASNDISVLYGDGLGGFAVMHTGLGGDNTFSIALADLNHDSNLDVVTANLSTSVVTVMLGDGAGNFTASTADTASSDTYSVAIGDVNADGHMDIVTANRGSSNVSILLGDGLGTFTASATSIGGGANPWSVSLADLDADGDLDIATANQGSSDASILLNDGAGHFTASVTGIAGGNNPIPIAIGNIYDRLAYSVAENTTSVATITASDPDAGQTLTWTIAGGADAAKFSINAGTGALSFVTAPDFEAPSDADGNNIYDVTVQVSDGNGGTDTQAIAVSVPDAVENTPPIALDTIVPTSEDTTITISLADLISDAETPDAALSITTVPIFGSGLENSVTINGVDLTFTPPANYYGNAVFEYTVTDAGGLTDQGVINFQVAGVNDPPHVMAPLPDRVAGEGVAVSFGVPTSGPSVTFGDIDAGNALTLSAALAGGGALPSWLDFNAGTGVFSGLPGFSDGGTYSIAVTATDQDGATATDDFTLTVNEGTPPNAAPAITSNGSGEMAVVSVAENTTLVTMLTATDPDAGQTLSYSITGGEDAGLFEIRNGNELHFITAPDFEDLPGAGATLGYQVAVQVSDGNGGTDSQAIAVTVTDANENQAPTDIALAGPIVAENATNGTLIGLLTATDANIGDALSFSLVDNAGGRFAIANGNQLVVADSALLDFETAAAHGVVVRVTDVGGLSYDEPFTIALQNVVGATQSGGDRADPLTGTNEEETLNGNDGNDTLLGLGGNDSLTGGPGNDLLDGGSGNDTMVGGAGNDTYQVDRAADVVTELSNGGTDLVRTTLATYTLATEIENLTFTGTGNFSGTGNGLFNRITGADGNDVLDGLGGDDILIGGAGADRLSDGVGRDRLSGNDGADTFVASVDIDRDEVDGGAGNNTADYSAHTANLTVGLLSVGNFFVVGGSGNNTDILVNFDNFVGGSGNDAITGNGNANVLTGGAGMDTLNGGGGNDVIRGGTGADLMSGGTGDDSFVFGPGFGGDVINGFDANPSGGQDLLDVRELGITAGNFAARVVIQDLGADMGLHIDGTNSIILQGVNGNGANTITQSDFWLL